ncbi:MAG TPA: amidase [Myxococcota bacterium]
MTDLHFRSASDLTRALRRKEVSSVELLDQTLARVAKLNPRINAIVHLDAERAGERARAADAALARGESWGALHGLPITIKDSFEVAGMPCTSGAPELAKHVPARSADAAQRLQDAGAVVFGKTNLPLYAGDFQSYNAVYGTTHNPWDVTRGPGGSSGGSAAALAAGLTALELGSDIGGSIRNPSHYCGVYGHKPSYGLVPMRGHIPGPPGALAKSDLGVGGPMGRSAADLALGLDVLAGPEASERTAWRLELPPPRANRLADLRVGVWLDDPRGPVDAEVREVLERVVDAVAKAGARIDATTRPVDGGEQHRVYIQLLNAVMALGFPPEVLAGMEAAAAALPASDDSTQANSLRGAALRHREWIPLDDRRTRLRAQWASYFRDVDVLLCPIMPTAAFPHDHRPFDARTMRINGRDESYFQLFWAGHAVNAYLPATVAPAGRTRGGLPVGVQIVGPYLEDRTPIAFAALLADVLGGFTPPPGF